MFHHIAKLIWQSDIHVILGAQFEVPFFFTFILLLEKKFVRDTHGWEETLGTSVSVLFC